jgi:hypothetical protein
MKNLKTTMNKEKLKLLNDAYLKINDYSFSPDYPECDYYIDDLDENCGDSADYRNDDGYFCEIHIIKTELEKNTSNPEFSDKEIKDYLDN